ncbi:N-acetylglucosaminyl deacetylase, LmbE family [Thiohalospira halophila DSM 15071]|uniref:N-acetylglucosaminyl deacetylase, LmbE family n=1 Tax=Thiohalospira halophila DSM 15071 TaxID=1123397 RepID=A0A1I1NR80_9GAMM|nr:PIG-L deacetylase family protein [Thiohalospira halophila]SFC96230.1 N-acetylglucosaminyl deacetylase, LmbE family [Thiohalospira halophila DSM 15071]
MKRVLVFSAHPDDEALGCGGSIARWAEEGVAIHLAFIADGIGARNEHSAAEKTALQNRRAAAESAAGILGATSVHFDDLPDNQLDSVPLLEITQRVEALIVAHQPDTVVTHHAGDLNIDHRRVHQAVMTACRPQRGHPVRTILCFEVASSTEWQPPGSGAAFEPDWFVDISATLPRKLAALDAYAAEMRDWPHPRSREGVEHLARWRGATVGCDAAEAFMLARALR